MKKSISYEILAAKIDIKFNKYSKISFVMTHPVGFNVNNTTIIEFLKDEVATITYIPDNGMMTFYKRRSMDQRRNEFNILDEVCSFGPTVELIEMIKPYSRQNSYFNNGREFNSVEDKRVIGSMIDQVFESID